MQGRLQAVAVKATRRRPPRIPRLSRLREHRWSPPERAVVVLVVAIVMGSLFVTAYSLALGDPIPHRIQVALVGDSTGHTSTVDALEGVARGTLVLQRYPSVPAALHAIDEQQLCVALDLTSQPPTLYLSSAAGVSVARLLEGISTVDPTVRVVDTHPLPASDPNGLKIFYLMLVATIAGFLTTFQVRANAGGLSLGQWTVFVLALAVAASLAFTLVEGPLLGLLDLPVLESWAILALQLLAVASFALSRTCFLAARKAAPVIGRSALADLRVTLPARLVIRTPHSSHPEIRFAVTAISRARDRVASTARFSVENIVNSFIGMTVHPR